VISKEDTMALLRILTSPGVLPGPDDMAGLHLVLSSVERTTTDRYRISGHGPEELIPQLEALGCEVDVLMSTAAVDAYLARVAAAVGDSPEPPGPVT
jgi:hypothetical protein